MFLKLYMNILLGKETLGYKTFEMTARETCYEIKFPFFILLLYN